MMHITYMHHWFIKGECKDVEVQAFKIAWIPRHLVCKDAQKVL